MKPDAAIYTLALARFGLRAEEAVFIDDNAANVAGAAAVGMISPPSRNCAENWSD